MRGPDRQGSLCRALVGAAPAPPALPVQKICDPLRLRPGTLRKAKGQTGMDIVHGAGLEWSEGEEKHREGRLSFKNIFKGVPGTPENYRLVLTRNNGPYKSPRHHHNFDQVRFCLEGKLNIAPGVEIEAGDAGYL